MMACFRKKGSRAKMWRGLVLGLLRRSRCAADWRWTMNVRAWSLCLVLVGCALDSGDGRAGVGGASGISGSGGTGGTAVDAGNACALPFDVGDCDAAIPVWAFVPALGACFPHTYGGCGGNANNFASLADCQSACPSPSMGACPPNRIARTICVQCGLGGGCIENTDACALTCSSSAECASSAGNGVLCDDGVCQTAGCI